MAYKSGDIIKEVVRNSRDMLGPLSTDGNRWYEVLGFSTKNSGETPVYVIKSLDLKADGSEVLYNVEIDYLENNTEIVTETDWILNGPTDR